ncbi:hypothetical protein GJ744_008079 [Endocarpon pusillum]|uniref:Uncharacterized protein n=1 Tax=Endocarpon pusillum TaxID=364733 RepID=A0A8H7ALN3_9EURO|nr:hypothetical protein GJ744_008079 [Endocarpon pusillum]
MAAIALVVLCDCLQASNKYFPHRQNLFETTGYIRGHCTEPSYIVKYRAVMTLISFNIAYDLIHYITMCLSFLCQVVDAQN